MALFNADGSRAEMSGNGIRCLVQAWAPRSEPDRGRGAVATDAGLRTVGFGPGPDQPHDRRQRGDGRPSTPIEPPAGWAETGIDPMRPAAHLSLGNPHAVVAVDDVDAVDLAAARRARSPT